MKHFSLVKSLSRVINNRKGLLILCLITSVFGVNEAWGGSKYYAQVIVAKSFGSTGEGTVYVTSPDKTDDTKEGDKGKTKSFDLYATAATGSTFEGWTKTDKGTLPISDSNTSPYSVNALVSSTDNGTTTTNYYAIFTANTYKVIFNKNNDQASGSMDEQPFTYGTAQNLTANGFEKKYTVS